jgi:hypothetical protein
LYQSNYIKDIYMEIENIYIKECKGIRIKSNILLTMHISTTTNEITSYHLK